MDSIVMMSATTLRAGSAMHALRDTISILLGLLPITALAFSIPVLPYEGISPPRPTADESYRLPTLFYPLEYNITLTPYLETPPEKAFTFDGHVTITFTKRDELPYNYITLHANKLRIDEDTITIKDNVGVDYPVFDFVNRTSREEHFIDIGTNKNLEFVRTYYLDIDFKGVLDDDLQGFYRSRVINRDGSESWMAITQFEQTYARQAFPCFDEPALKAKFTLNIAHAPDYTVLANMPLAAESPMLDPLLPGWSWSHFEQSVVMSSYLVAFSVNQYSSLNNENDPRFKVWSKPDSIQFGAVANDVAPLVIKLMENYTGHPYTLSKMDQIAVPTLSFGAMENWGLVTYREYLLLFEEGVSTTADRETVTTIVTHELAHQWFGNIVSPSWWQSTWLNEGFATYFEYYMSGVMEPTWEMEDLMVQEQTRSVLLKDATNFTHPLLTEVDTPASATAAFDSIAYNKGGSIVRMIVSIMGEEEFKVGINVYLTDKQFSSADASDLWRNLAPYVPPENLPSGKTFSQVMEPWNSQSGYPVVTVVRDYNPANRGANFTQERFIMERSNWVTTEKWDVPLSITTQEVPIFDDVTPVAWQSGDVPTELTGLAANSDEWIMVNVKQVGYYRVNYDVRNWFLINFAMSTPDTLAPIHPINRAQVMDDAMALARGGKLAYDTALETTAYLALEDNYGPWATALTALSYIYDRISNETTSRHLFQDYMVPRLDPVYDLVGGVQYSPDDPHAVRRMRVLVLKWACLLGHAACNADESALFRAWQAQVDPDLNNPIVPDLRSSTYCSGMRTGGAFDYEFLITRYVNAVLRKDEQARIISGLGCPTQTFLLQIYLDESIAENSRILPSDAQSALAAVYNNYIGVDLALDFLIANWERSSDVYGGRSNLGSAFTGIAPKLNTQQQLTKLEMFYGDNDLYLGDAVSGVLSAINTLEIILEWQEAYRGEVIDYFAQAQAPSDSN